MRVVNTDTGEVVQAGLTIADAIWVSVAKNREDNGRYEIQDEPRGLKPCGKCALR